MRSGGRESTPSTTSASRFALAHYKANAAHRVNQARLALDVDLAAQARHLHVDDVVERRRATRLSPHVSGEHFARDQMSLMAQEVLEQLELATGQVDQPVAADETARHQI